jgi:hemerythrin-like domain-containing protein
MSAHLERLREDHRHTAVLLDALERQIGIFADAGAPDYDVIVGAAEYLLDYPNLRHRPAEDAIAARLLTAHPVEAAVILDLVGEHELAHERARRFRHTMRALLGDTDIARDAVVHAAQRFIGYERRHMLMEEAVFFPLAERLLSDADWRAIEVELEERTGPAFRTEVDASLTAMRERLLAWEAEDELETPPGDA